MSRSKKVSPSRHEEVSTFSFFGSSITKPLEDIKANHEDTCRQRRHGIHSILHDQKLLASWWNLLWTLPGLVIGMAAVFVGFVLVPFHNVFHRPDQWWEMMLQCAVVGTGMTGCYCGDRYDRVLLWGQVWQGVLWGQVWLAVIRIIIFSEWCTKFRECLEKPISNKELL